MNRVRYAENGDTDEVRYFIHIKGLNLWKFPQLELKNKIEELLETIPLKAGVPQWIFKLKTVVKEE